MKERAAELLRLRSPDASDRNHPLYRQNPEAWLESQVRGNIREIDASLLPSPVYGQVPAFAAADRGVLDLLAVDHRGRLAVIELKASEDVHLPLQALDYWMRVQWHVERREFQANGYFPGRELLREPPRLLLVSPALDIHSSNERVLRYLSPQIPVERIGLGLEWRKELKVMYRSVAPYRTSAWHPNMPIQVFQHVKDAIRNLDPEDIRKHTDRPLRLLLYADSERHTAHMEDYLLRGSFARQTSPGSPPDLSWIGRHRPRVKGDLEIYFDPSESLDRANPKYSDSIPEPGATVRQMLQRRPDLAVPLALHVLPFREEVSRRMVKKVAKENALFALATAVPDIIPFISLPWAMGEFASDTAFLTANQIRMAFLLAAANDRDIGYHEQRGEIASIILGAFGWRALARELVGKIPWGGGLGAKSRHRLRGHSRGRGCRSNATIAWAKPTRAPNAGWPMRTHWSAASTSWPG